MKINLKLFKCLNDHLDFKLANHSWLNQCLEGTLSAFPYRIKNDGKASLDRFIHLPAATSNEQLSPMYLENRPSYLVNIPMAYNYLRNNSLQNFLKLFQDEAFGINAIESLTSVRQRLAIVIGINQPYSIDNAVNEEFVNCILALPRIQNIACSAFGFFWHPQWEFTSNISKLYPIQKGYLLLKALAKEKATSVRDLVEGKNDLSKQLTSQIPFQQIRECIKDSSQSRFFASYFEQYSPQSPIYLGIMDSDCIALRSNLGLFSLLDQEILNQNNPSAITCGYQAQNNELPIIRLGIKLDMAVRAAMNSIVPYSAYLPEPGSFFCIRIHPGSNILRSLSFIGKGRTLETRRLIQNGRLKKLFNDRVVFLKDGGVTIKVPNRMKTKKNGLIQLLTPQILKQKSKLQALRNISQTHAIPKQWADNLYVVLGFSYSRVTDVTVHMMHIFQVFDPISRMFSLLDRYSIINFDQVMNNYHNALLEGEQKLLETARSKLYQLEMPLEKINIVEQTAKASGEAIYQVLLQAISSTD